MINKFGISLLFIFLKTVSIGQSENSVDENSEKSIYFKMVYQKCPTADILELEFKEDYVEIEFLCEGIFNEVGIKNGEIIFTESEADKSQVPLEKIKKKLNKKYDDWLFDEISLISMKDTSFYKVEIIKDGVEQNLFFTTEGKKYKSNLVGGDDKWSIENLKDLSAYKNADYKYLTPDSTYFLPDVLNEISGLKLTNTNTALCVQDELGAVFEYNFSERAITNLYRFTDVGDFEDLAIKGDMLFVLRSDGTIFYFNYKNKEDIEERTLPLDALDYESLTNDSDSFYILSKDAGMQTGALQRVIYKFSMEELTKPKKAIAIDIKELNQFYKRKFGTLGSTNIQFNPSALAVHPISGNYYVLSATERMVAIYKKTGELINLYPLPASVYYKPEGLTFFLNGDMLISSEGDKRGLIKGQIHLLRNLSIKN